MQLVDVFRGIAVVLMIAWHCTDGWMAEVHRVGLAWRFARVSGGLAAPFFLFAVGLGVALGARRGRGLSRALVRGLELIVLGHALRLGTWAVDRQAIFDLHALPALALGVAFVTFALLAVHRPRRARRFGRIAVALGVLHIAAVLGLGPRLARIVLRFDVLHCIGASVIVCALVAYRATRWRLAWAPSAVLGIGGLAIVLASTPLVTALDDAGAALAWLARARELRSVAPFPLVPWCGYAMVGCAAALAPLRWGDQRRVAAAFVIALALAVVSFEGGLHFTRSALSELPFLRPLARVTFHASVAVAVGCALHALTGRARIGDVLATLGRASLPIYMLHLQVAYGKLAGPIEHALSPLATAALIGLVMILSTAGARIAERRGARREPAHIIPVRPPTRVLD